MMFTWKPIYTELAKKLLEYRNHRHELIEILSDAKKQGLKVIMLQDENPKGNKIPLEDIDPFTFFASFNKGSKADEVAKILQYMKDRFELKSDIPKDYSGIPTMIPMNTWFFSYAYMRGKDDIDNLWELAEAAITKNVREIDSDIFEKCLKIKGSNIGNITMGLFWFCPDKYLALDSKNRAFLKDSYEIGYTEKKWQSYLELLEKVKLEISPDFPDISHEAHLIATGKNPKGHRPFPKETKNPQDPDGPDINAQYPLNTILYGPPGTGKTYTSLKRAVEIVDGKPPFDKDFTAVKIRFDELYKAGQIRFITFHQSYSYEDFVEGIRPDIEGCDKTNSPRYVCRDGIFKQICAEAEKSKSVESDKLPDFDLDKAQIWKMSLGHAKDPKEINIYEECIKGNFIAHGAGRGLDFTECKNKNDIKNMLSGLDWNHWPSTIQHNINQIYALKFLMKLGDMVIISDANPEFRAIGMVSGDYFFDEAYIYKQKRSVKWLKIFDKSRNAEQILKDVKFTHKTLYKLSHEKLKLDELKKLLVSHSHAGNPKKYVLIIDEINRGNISKILGELITLLEPDKRLGAKHALKVTLPYSQKEFGVPGNLYIIGTMNTADKSIALVDVALRRRFVFEELTPDLTVCKDLTKEMRDVLQELNKRITLRKDRDHQIGHSYFMDVQDTASFNSSFKEKIIPLLQEYFWNDWEGLKFVLGEENSDTGPFICKIPGCENANRYVRNKWQWYSDAGEKPPEYLNLLQEKYFSKDKKE